MGSLPLLLLWLQHWFSGGVLLKTNADSPLRLWNVNKLKCPNVTNY